MRTTKVTLYSFEDAIVYHLRAFILVLVMALWTACIESPSDESTQPPSIQVDTSAPIWPQDASIELIEAGRSYIRLRWTAASDDVAVVRYPITGDLVGDHYSTSSSALISGLAPGQSYDFEVHALDAVGNSTAYPLSIHASTATGCTATLPVTPARITR